MVSVETFLGDHRCLAIDDHVLDETFPSAQVEKQAGSNNLLPKGPPIIEVFAYAFAFGLETRACHTSSVRIPQTAVATLGARIVSPCQAVGQQRESG